jgi:hypothetical protein
MDDICALDFTEQLLIFREFGMIYARPEFIQANEVSYSKGYVNGFVFLIFYLASWP